MNVKTPRVLVLSSAETEESVPLNDHFIAELHKRINGEIDIEWHNYHAIRVEFKQGSLRVWLAESGTELKDFDFVYYKSFFRHSEYAGVIASYLDAHNVPFVSSELRNHIPLTKLTQLSRLSLADLPIAKTVFMLHDQWPSEYATAVQSLGVPFIFKSTDGSGGEENYLIHTEEEFQAALAAFPKLQFIAQQYIENDSDLRVLIVGGEIKLIIKRQRTDAEATHLNNTSQGADAFLQPIEELAPEHQLVALESSRIMQREIAGVDLLFELGTGRPYILEVNASPQIASGAFAEEKLAIYTEYFINVVKSAQK